MEADVRRKLRGRNRRAGERKGIRYTEVGGSGSIQPSGRGVLSSCRRGLTTQEQTGYHLKRPISIQDQLDSTTSNNPARATDSGSDAPPKAHRKEQWKAVAEQITECPDQALPRCV